MINEKRLLGLFKELVSIDSPSFHERRMADRLTELLTELGFEVREDSAGAAIGGDCGNLYAYLPGTLPGLPVVFSAHMDTVRPCEGKEALISPDGTIKSSGDTVLGSDDLSGVCEIIEAVRSIREDGLPHRGIELILSVAEEHFLKGSEYFDVSVLRGRECYVFDSDEEIGTVILGAPTGIRLLAEIKGVSAHAALRPEEGVNAIAIAARAIASMKLGRLDEETTANIGIIRGGSSGNIVPDSCFVEGETRSLSDEKAEAQADHMCRCFTEAAEALGGSCELTRTKVYPAYRVDENEEFVQRFFRACRKLGIEPRSASSCGGSDNSMLSKKGLRGVVVACGMHRVHSCAEYTSVRELVIMSELAQELMTMSD